MIVVARSSLSGHVSELKRWPPGIGVSPRPEADRRAGGTNPANAHKGLTWATAYTNAVGFAPAFIMIDLRSHIPLHVRLPGPGRDFDLRARALRLSAVLISLVSVAAVCVSKGGDVEIVEDITLVTEDLKLVVEATRADIEFFKGEPGSVITRGEFGNRPKVVHRVRPGAVLPTSHLLIETNIPLKYAPRSRAIVRIWIPDGTEIEVNGDDVSVEISGPDPALIAVNGVITLTKGDAILTDVTGNFDITTGVGGITLNRVSGEFDAITGRGSLFFRGAPTESVVSRLETGAGSIFADLSSTPDLPFSAEAGRGAILLHDGKDPISGANIAVLPVEGVAALELVTANGIIDIRR